MAGWPGGTRLPAVAVQQASVEERARASKNCDHPACPVIARSSSRVLLQIIPSHSFPSLAWPCLAPSRPFSQGGGHGYALWVEAQLTLPSHTSFQASWQALIASAILLVLPLSHAVTLLALTSCASPLVLTYAVVGAGRLTSWGPGSSLQW